MHQLFSQQMKNRPVNILINFDYRQKFTRIFVLATNIFFAITISGRVSLCFNKLPCFKCWLMAYFQRAESCSAAQDFHVQKLTLQPYSLCIGSFLLLLYIYREPIVLRYGISKKNFYFFAVPIYFDLLRRDLALPRSPYESITLPPPFIYYWCKLKKMQTLVVVVWRCSLCPVLQ